MRLLSKFDKIPTNLMLEALPAVTEPPVSLKLGRSLRNLAASNWDIKRKKKYQYIGLDSNASINKINDYMKLQN